MQENVYAVPASVVLDVEDTPVADSGFYVVSPRKFVLLFFASLGIYQIFWFYLNWRRQKMAAGLKVQPAVRGLFALFFAHKLFRRIDNQLKARGVAHQWSPVRAATIYVVLTIFSAMSDRILEHSLGQRASGTLSIVTLCAVLLPLLDAQRAINAASKDPDGIGNSRFSTANIVLLVAGACFWLLILASLIV